MKFIEFCTSKTTPTPLKVKDENDLNVPEQYMKPIETLIKLVKPKLEMLDRINIPFIEKSFECDYAKILEAKLPSAEIPDSVINKITEGIYNMKISDDMTPEQIAIIKILSVYICIQN